MGIGIFLVSSTIKDTDLSEVKMTMSMGVSVDDDFSELDSTRGSKGVLYTGDEIVDDDGDETAGWR